MAYWRDYANGGEYGPGWIAGITDIGSPWDVNAAPVNALGEAAPFQYNPLGDWRRAGNTPRIEYLDNGQWTPWNATVNSMTGIDAFWNTVNNPGLTDYAKTLDKPLGDFGTFDQTDESYNQAIVDAIRAATVVAPTNTMYGAPIKSPGFNADALARDYMTPEQLMEQNSVALTDANGNIVSRFVPSRLFGNVTYGNNYANETYGAPGVPGQLDESGIRGSLAGLGEGYYVDPNKISGFRANQVSRNYDTRDNSVLGGIDWGMLAAFAGIGGLGMSGLLNGLGGGMSAADALATTGLDLGTAGAGSAATSAAGAAGSNSMFDGFGDWFSNLFNGGGVTDIPQYLDPNAASYSGGYDFTSSNPWDFGPGNFQDGGWGYGPGNINDIGTNLGVTPGSGITASQASQLVNSAKSILGNNTSLLGTALGGLLGGMNGSKQAGNITTTQEPWGPQQAYLLDAWNKAKQASAGTPLQTQANSNYQSVLSGPTKNPYLGMDNPYLTKAIDYANEDVTRAMMPAMNQANRASGSFGNSGVADQFSRAMTDQYGRNANSMRMQDYTNQQNLAQQQVNNTLGFTQNANTYAAQPSQNYANTVGGQNFGGSRSEPYMTNPLNGILGGAMIGNALGSNKSIWG